jgi:hypothetical protein
MRLPLENNLTALRRAASTLRVGRKASLRSLADAPTGDSCCELCSDYVFKPTNPDLTPLALVYLCHHIVHAQCALLDPTSELPLRPDPVNSMLFASQVSAQSRGTRRIDVMGRNLGGKLAYAATLRVKEGRCPVCTRKAESRRAAG